MGLDFNPAFLHVDEADTGADAGLTISSFHNAYVNPAGPPPFGYFERDLVARIEHLACLDIDQFDPAVDVDILTDLGPGAPATVWPNEAVRAPAGVFPFDAVVVPQGFHPTAAPGRLTAIDLDDPARTEYIIHQSTQAAPGGPIIPGDPANSPRFYHRVLFLDVNADGLDDLVTARSGFRVGPVVYPPFSELVAFLNPGAALDPLTPWDELVLFGGPTAGFLGPDIHLDAHDFEGDGVPEIVATHFFTGDTTNPPTRGKIALYGAPVGGTWADVVTTPGPMFNPARVKDISTDQGFPFDVQIVDLNLDGKADVLASNHQPDNCLPFTSSEVPGRVYALEQPASGDLFVDAWTTRILLDDIRPNPTLAPVRPPGRLAPGRAQAFAPIGVLDGVIKPSVVVSGDEAGKVWLLTPVRRRDASDWRYRTSVIFDINAFYGPNTTQTPMADPFGITISTVGAVAVRHDGPGGIGFAELYIPVFEAKDIHVLTLRPGAPWDRVACAPNESLSCPAP